MASSDLNSYRGVKDDPHTFPGSQGGEAIRKWRCPTTGQVTMKRWGARENTTRPLPRPLPGSPTDLKEERTWENTQTGPLSLVAALGTEGRREGGGRAAGLGEGPLCFPANRIMPSAEAAISTSWSIRTEWLSPLDSGSISEHRNEKQSPELGLWGQRPAHPRPRVTALNRTFPAPPKGLLHSSLGRPGGSTSRGSHTPAPGCRSGHCFLLSEPDSRVSAVNGTDKCRQQAPPGDICGRVACGETGPI